MIFALFFESSCHARKPLNLQGLFNFKRVFPAAYEIESLAFSQTALFSRGSLDYLELPFIAFSTTSLGKDAAASKAFFTADPASEPT